MTTDPADCPLWNAQYHLRFAYEYCIIARTCKSNNVPHGFYECQGFESLTRAADALGFDLVKRQKQEAA